MKKRITEIALEGLAREMAYVRKKKLGGADDSGLPPSYWDGKHRGLVEAFSLLTGQRLVDANVMLLDLSDEFMK